MRARCERHALALGPSGCPICRREQAPLAAEPSEAAAPADAARSAPPPPPAPPVTAEPAREAPTLPDSAPTAPTVTDAPEPPRLSIRIHPAALLLVPLVLLGAYWALSSRSPSPASLDAAPSSIDEVSRAALDPTEVDAPASEREDTALEDGAEPTPDDLAEPAEPPAVIVARTAELERTREQAQHAAEQLDAARSRVKVILYTTERCTRCTEARSYLVARGIYPTERDIDKDARARARHRALTRKGGLPTLEIDGKVLVGFHPERLDKAIQRAATVRLKPRKR